jgi:aminoglycoside phosphotransferase (APT) family kinase protein
MDHETVFAVLRDTLGSGVEITVCTLLKKMQDYRIWEVETRRPNLHLIVKQAGPRAFLASTFERTAALHRLVRERTATSIPGTLVPEVIAADESCHKWPWRYFIKTYLPGTEWAAVAKTAQPAALEKARFQLGEAVAALHQIRFEGFGELDRQAGVCEPLPYPEALARRVQQMIASPPARNFILALLERKAALFRGIAAPALCHEDLHWHNLLLDRTGEEWRLAGILDFEKAWAGDREIDLARMELWRMTSEPFWNAYQKRCPVDAGSAEWRAAYQLIWCVEFAEDTNEQIDITRRLCRSLGMPVIESFKPFKVMKDNRQEGTQDAWKRKQGPQN